MGMCSTGSSAGNWHPCCDVCKSVAYDFDSGASGGPLDSDWGEDSTILNPHHEINSMISPENRHIDDGFGNPGQLSTIQYGVYLKSSAFSIAAPSGKGRSITYTVHGDSSNIRSIVRAFGLDFRFNEGKIYNFSPNGTNEIHHYTITGVTTNPSDSGGTFDITWNGETRTVDWAYGTWRANAATFGGKSIAEKYRSMDGIGSGNAKANTPPDADTCEIEFYRTLAERDITIPLPTFDLSNLSGSPSLDANTRVTAASVSGSEDPPLYEGDLDGLEIQVCAGGDHHPGFIKIDGVVYHVGDDISVYPTFSFGDVGDGISDVSLFETYHDNNQVCPRCSHAHWPMRDDLEDGVPAQVDLVVSSATAQNPASDCVADNCSNLDGTFTLDLLWTHSSAPLGPGSGVSRLYDDWNNLHNPGDYECTAVWELDIDPPISVCGDSIDRCEVATFEWGKPGPATVLVTFYDSTDGFGGQSSSHILMGVQQENYSISWARDGTDEPLDVDNAANGGGFEPEPITWVPSLACHDVQLSLTPVFSS